MSKRFGRNQKRKLVQQLAEQKANAERFEYAYEMSDELLRNTREKLSEAMFSLESIYTDIAKHLNPYHPLLPTELRSEITVQHEAKSIRLTVPKGPMEFYVKVADILRKKIVTEEFSNMVTVKVMHGHRVVGYGIDKDALQLKTIEHQMISFLAVDIAKQLLSAIGEKGASSR